MHTANGQKLQETGVKQKIFSVYEYEYCYIGVQHINTIQRYSYYLVCELCKMFVSNLEVAIKLHQQILHVTQ